MLDSRLIARTCREPEGFHLKKVFNNTSLVLMQKTKGSNRMRSLCQNQRAVFSFTSSNYMQKLKRFFLTY